MLHRHTIAGLRSTYVAKLMLCFKSGIHLHVSNAQLNIVTCSLVATLQPLQLREQHCG